MDLTRYQSGPRMNLVIVTGQEIRDNGRGGKVETRVSSGKVRRLEHNLLIIRAAAPVAPLPHCPVDSLPHCLVA
jgi:hypothetical protein